MPHDSNKPWESWGLVTRTLTYVWHNEHQGKSSRLTRKRLLVHGKVEMYQVHEVFVYLKPVSNCSLICTISIRVQALEITNVTHLMWQRLKPTTHLDSQATQERSHISACFFQFAKLLPNFSTKLFFHIHIVLILKKHYITINADVESRILV